MLLGCHVRVLGRGGSRVHPRPRAHRVRGVPRGVVRSRPRRRRPIVTRTTALILVRIMPTRWPHVLRWVSIGLHVAYTPNIQKPHTMRQVKRLIAVHPSGCDHGASNLNLAPPPLRTKTRSMLVCSRCGL